MNDYLQNIVRDEIKNGLSICNEQQQFLFKRLYSKNLDMPLHEVVDNIPPEKLNTALGQINRAIEKKQEKNKC